MRKDFYKIVDGKPKEIVDAILVEDKKIRSVYAEIAEQYGADTFAYDDVFKYYRAIYNIFVFKQENKPKGWSQADCSDITREEIALKPRKNSTTEKEIRAKIENAHKTLNILRKKLFAGFAEAHVKDGKLYTPNIQIYKKQVIASISMDYDIKPKDIEGLELVNSWEL